MVGGGNPGNHGVSAPGTPGKCKQGFFQSSISGMEVLLATWKENLKMSLLSTFWRLRCRRGPGDSRGIGAAPSPGQAAVAACEGEKPGTFTLEFLS